MKKWKKDTAFFSKRDFSLVIAGGEAAKTREMKEYVENELLKSGMRPNDLLVAIGGGTITDLVGFVASTLYRGVSYVNVPTTLLGMVDASIGGKTGVNTSFGKNTIGSFYFPLDIYIDIRFLETLPKTEFLMGFSEVVKYGIIFDAELFGQLERDHFDVEHVVRRSREIKETIVNLDPRESGLRQILNFGHTIGHGLELISDYQMPHGFAVATGIGIEAAISYQEGLLPKGDLERIITLLRRYEFPLQSFSKELLYSAMLRDKKNRRGEIHFVLIDKIGRCIERNGAYSFPISKEKIWSIV